MDTTSIAHSTRRSEGLVNRAAARLASIRDGGRSGTLWIAAQRSRGERANAGSTGASHSCAATSTHSTRLLARGPRAAAQHRLGPSARRTARSDTFENGLRELRAALAQPAAV